MKSNAKKRVTLITLLLTVAIFTFSIYIGSQPEKYNLNIGDVSDYDIVAPRAIADSIETQKRAAQAQADIQTVMMRSEQTSSAVISDVTRFLDIVQERREAIYKVQPPETETPDSEGDNSRGEPTNETKQEPSTNLRQPKN